MFNLALAYMYEARLFDIQNESEFEVKALEVFQFQYRNNPVYQEFCSYLGRNPKNVHQVVEIPFLPIEFFKSKMIVTGQKKPQISFSSSGTTGHRTSRHLVTNLEVYEESYLRAFKHFYGDIKDYCILALLPSYLEREGSSLIYMVNDLISKSGHSDSG